MPHPASNHRRRHSDRSAFTPARLSLLLKAATALLMLLAFLAGSSLLFAQLPLT